MALSDETRQKIPKLTTGRDVPLHAALTDVPVATFSLMPVFDGISFFTRSDTAGGAGLWTGIMGAVWALPTATAGLVEYLRAPAGTPVKRIGITHALLNTTAFGLVIGSLAARRLRSKPTALSLALSAGAGAIVTYSSHLGGVMVYQQRMGVRAEEPEDSGSARAASRVASSGARAPVSPLCTDRPQPETIGGAGEDTPEEIEPVATAMDESAESPDDAETCEPAATIPPDEARTFVDARWENPDDEQETQRVSIVDVGLDIEETVEEVESGMEVEQDEDPERDEGRGTQEPAA